MMKSDARMCRTQAEARWDGDINLSTYNFNQFKKRNFDAMLTLPLNRSRPWNLALNALRDSLVHHIKLCKCSDGYMGAHIYF